MKSLVEKLRAMSGVRSIGDCVVGVLVEVLLV
jgi:hypothetical protein